MLAGKHRPVLSTHSVSPLRIQQSQPLLNSMKIPSLRSSQNSFRSGTEADTKATEMTAMNVQLELQLAERCNQVQELQQALLRSEDLAENLRKDLKEKNRHVGELQRMVAEYERKMQMYMEVERNSEVEIRSEELQSQLVAKDAALRESSRLIQQLLMRNKELEAKHGRDYSSKNQTERRHLKEQLNSLAQSSVPKTDYEALHRKFTNLEANFAKTQEVAVHYQKKLTTISQSGVMTAPEHLQTTAQELARIQTDIKQITAAVKMVHDSQEVNLGLLLSLTQTVAQYESPSVTCAHAVSQLKTEVAQLRATVSDYLAEQCGHGCTQH